MRIAASLVADGAWIFLAVIVVWLLSIAYGYYTRRGSAINQHPHAGVYSRAPGAKTPSVLSHDRSAAERLTGRRRTGEPRRAAKRRRRS